MSVSRIWRACSAGYDIGVPLSFKGIAEGVENSNFYLQTDRGAYILTLYEKRVRIDDLPFFLGLMEHLAARGLTCPQPLRARDGAQWVMLKGRAAAVLTFLNGISLRRPEAAIAPRPARRLAQLHEAGQGFALSRPNALSLAGWRELAAATAARADAVQDGLAALIARNTGRAGGAMAQRPARRPDSCRSVSGQCPVHAGQGFRPDRFLFRLS